MEICDESRDIRATGSFKKPKNTFLFILPVLGWSKLLDLDWRSRKFPRMDSLARKKNRNVR